MRMPKEHNVMLETEPEEFYQMMDRLLRERLEEFAQRLERSLSPGLPSMPLSVQLQPGSLSVASTSDEVAAGCQLDTEPIAPLPPETIPDAMSSVPSKKTIGRKSTWNFEEDEDLRKSQAEDAGDAEDTGDDTDAASAAWCTQSSCSLKSIVQNLYFEVIWAVAILTNSLFVGLQVNMAATAEIQGNAPEWLTWVSWFYNAAFFIECLMRFGADRWGYLCGAGWSWNYFDIFIVCTSLVEIFFEQLYVGSHEGDDDKISGNATSVRVIRILRITRLVRIFRIVRIVRFVRALRTLVYSIIATLRSLVWAVTLLVMIIYVFACMFTQAITDHVIMLDVGADIDLFYTKYWGSLVTSMITLFASLSNGISWVYAIEPLESVSSVWVGLFIFYMCFTFLAVLNVVTGVFCQSAIEGAQHDQEMLIQEALKIKGKHMERIQLLFQSIDTDGSGDITIKELEKVMNDKAMQAYLEALELDASDAWTLFKLLDTDAKHTIDCDDFMMGCMRLKGAAKAIDVAQLLYENRQLKQTLGCFMNVIEEKLEKLEVVAVPQLQSSTTAR